MNENVMSQIDAELEHAGYELTQDILKNRIIRLLNNSNTNLTNPTNNSLNSCNSWSEKIFDVFNVRAVEWNLWRALLTEAVRRCKPDLVIVDGIRDLVNDINGGVLAQEAMVSFFGSHSLQAKRRKRRAAIEGTQELHGLRALLA